MSLNNSKISRSPQILSLVVFLSEHLWTVGEEEKEWKFKSYCKAYGFRLSSLAKLDEIFSSTGCHLKMAQSKAVSVFTQTES